MATYNGAQYILEQLESIAAQSELPAEVIISDDGSTDATIEIAKRFGQAAPFAVRILPGHQRLGFADNFLHAAENCHSPLIMFCDQDDIWLPHKLARSRSRLLQDNSLMLLHTLALVDTALKPIGVFTQGIEQDRCFGPLELEPYLCGHGNTMLLRRELLWLFPRSERPLIEGDRLLSHDTWLYTLAAALGNVSHEKQSLVQYRQHDENVSSLDDRSMFQKVRDLLNFAVGHHEQKAAFNFRMEEIFREIAASNTKWNHRATVASNRYRERAKTIQKRVEVYTGPSLKRRLQAFRKLRSAQASCSEAKQESYLTHLKDLLVGVSGIRTLFD